MPNTKAYAAHGVNQPLKPFEFDRREPGSNDVEIDVHFCGVCHSDLHSVNGDWGVNAFPLVPGHEVVGVVTRVGGGVRRFRQGDKVGVGCMVDSCRKCQSCEQDLQQYCEKGATLTYGSPDPKATKSTPYTQGGYSTKITVDQDFVLHIPENLPLDRAAPLLCAGITTYSPLKHWNVGTGKKVAIAGLGGLGHMGVKIAAKMGADVTVLSTSDKKRLDAESLGAHGFLNMKDPVQVAKGQGQFDFILNTISAAHDYDAYLNLLKRDGTMCLVGLPAPQQVAAFSLVLRRRALAGSLIGGIAETQEMLNFCGANNIPADIELIPIQKINEAYARMVKADVRYRFVIDIKKSLG